MMVRAGIGLSVEGTHAVAAALRVGRVTALTVERGRADSSTVAALIALAKGAGVSVAYVDDVRPIAETTAPQGVVATTRPLPLLSLNDLVMRSSPAAIVVLDRVEDPRNVGAIARSAAAAGVTGLVVAERRAAPISAAAFKAAAGAFEDLSVAAVGSIGDAIRDLRKFGVWTVGLDEMGERSLFGLDLLAEPVGLVLGAEGKGLSRLVRDRVDLIVNIPTDPAMPTINVSAAATLAVFEITRARAG
jgi:23S rRNA (guanosine2251-2'-O)-methyltransferase